MAHRLEWHAEPKYRTAADLAAHAGFTSHHPDEPPHDRQPQPGAAEVPGGRGIRLYERVEQRLQRMICDADTRIANLETNLRAVALRSHGKDMQHHLALSGELDGVADEINQALA